MSRCSAGRYRLGLLFERPPAPPFHPVSQQDKMLDNTITGVVEPRLPCDNVHHWREFVRAGRAGPLMRYFFSGRDVDQRLTRSYKDDTIDLGLQEVLPCTLSY